MEFDLGSNKYLTVSDFKDVTYVHVRQFEQGKNGKIPTKVGVHFTPQTFDSFIEAIRDIDVEEHHQSREFPSPPLWVFFAPPVPNEPPPLPKSNFLKPPTEGGLREIPNS